MSTWKKPTDGLTNEQEMALRDAEREIYSERYDYYIKKSAKEIKAVAAAKVAVSDGRTFAGEYGLNDCKYQLIMNLANFDSHDKFGFYNAIGCR